jgi:hypothetical protein
MNALIHYIVKGITNDKDIEIVKNEEEGREIYDVMVEKDNIGKVIGKGGSVIRAIRNIVKTRAILEKKSVFVNVSEKI